MIRKLLSLVLILSVLSISMLGAAHSSEVLGQFESGIHVHIGDSDHHDHDHSDHHPHDDNMLSGHDHEEGTHVHFFFQMTSEPGLVIHDYDSDLNHALLPTYVSQHLTPPVPPPNA